MSKALVRKEELTGGLTDTPLSTLHSPIDYPCAFTYAARVEKIFVTAEQLLADSFELGLRIFESGYRPTFIVGVWRGGAPIGIAVQEVLELLGCKTNHFAIRTSSYDGLDKPSKDIKLYGLAPLAEMINADDNLLIIDDVFDSGRSVDAILKTLNDTCGQTIPHDIRVATVYYKPSRNATTRVPDFYVHETDEWTVFPHELDGISIDEIRKTKPLPRRIYKLLDKG